MKAAQDIWDQAMASGDKDFIVSAMDRYMALIRLIQENKMDYLMEEWRN